MFRKAERRKAKLRLAITDPAGSGKTYGALQIAQVPGGRIAMIDTENVSGDLYADIFRKDFFMVIFRLLINILPAHVPYRTNLAVIEDYNISFLIGYLYCSYSHICNIPRYPCHTHIISNMY